MAIMHLFLQNKGGVGKSACAYYFTQFLRDQGKKILAYDADPNNRTFSCIRSLKSSYFPTNDAGTKTSAFEIDAFFHKITEENHEFLCCKDPDCKFAFSLQDKQFIRKHVIEE